MWWRLLIRAKTSVHSNQRESIVEWRWIGLLFTGTFNTCLATVVYPYPLHTWQRLYIFLFPQFLIRLMKTLSKTILKKKTKTKNDLKLNCMLGSQIIEHERQSKNILFSLDINTLRLSKWTTQPNLQAVDVFWFNLVIESIKAMDWLIILVFMQMKLNLLLLPTRFFVQNFMLSSTL